MKTFHQIYQLTQKIPKGKVATYKQLAVLAGIKNPRVVGFAMRTNKDPKNIPCHRVVGSDGTLRGYAFGGIQKKKEILQQEGVIFLKNGRVNLKESLYS